ncbi:MAG: SDR family NAD(P)-dependent oxidoreductase [Saprospiraceae bacterium]|nr:SDR family NAD(P)-dependent oxidoreductase [Saprospiraceae bacterium]
MKRILVTGANGFIGSHLVRRLAAQKDVEVLAMHREHSDLRLVRDLNQSNIRWVTGDILVLHSLRDLIRQADVVVHNAALVSYALRDRQQMTDVNVEGTTNVVNAMLDAHEKKRLVYISSVAATGHAEKGMIDELSEWRDELYHTHYSWTKYWAELEVWRGFAEGLSGLIFNPSTVLGIGTWSHSSCQLFDQVWKGLRFYAAGGTGFVDVRDVVDAVWQGIVREELTEERYILNGTNTSYRDLLTRIATLLHRPAPAWEVRPGLRRLALGMVAPLEAMGWWRHPISTEILRNTGKTNRFNSHKAETTFDLPFKPLDETLQYICRQFLAEHS